MLAKPKSRHLTVRLEDELHEAIAAAAQEDRRPVSNWIRNALQDRIEQRPAAQEHREVADA
jgi:predicted HicB family RNase H-like nuclease